MPGKAQFIRLILCYTNWWVILSFRVLLYQSLWRRSQKHIHNILRLYKISSTLLFFAYICVLWCHKRIRKETKASAKMQIQSEQTVKRQKNTRNTLSEKKYCYSELILRDCCVRHVFNKLQTYKNGTSDCLIAVFGDFKLFSTVKLLLLIKCIIFSFSLMIHQFL